VRCKRTIVGQLGLDCEVLPEELQSQLKEIIRQEYVKERKHR